MPNRANGTLPKGSAGSSLHSLRPVGWMMLKMIDGACHDGHYMVG
ncbi:MAG TPA: hypothetical protein VFR47_24600 [Anaerolineales bacterium]|nr:hypothetical protein [Anaerolineales bacterium]